MSADLIAPLIDDRHVDVINEHSHLFASRWPVRTSDPLIDVAFDGTLEHEGSGGTREVKAFGEMGFCVISRHKAFNHHSLCCSLFSYQKHSFLLFSCKIEMKSIRK